MQTALNVIPDIDACPTGWAEMPDSIGQLSWVCGVPNGTTGGKPSVALRIELPDGGWMLVETTWALFHMAAKGLEGALGWPA